MIEAMLQRFGVPQNAERLKTEWGREAKGQFSYGTAALRASLRVGVFYAVAGLFGIITVVASALLFYAWLRLYVGDLGAMAVTAFAFGLLTFFALWLAQTKIAEMPVYQPFQVPQFYKKIELPQSAQQDHAPPVQRAADYTDPRRARERSMGAEGESVEWVLGLVKQGYARNLNTGVTAVDSFLHNMRPDAEVMARKGLQTVEDQLRNGSRPTIAAILLGGLVSGFLLSSRGGIKHL